MLARLIATVAALLLACASPQAQAHVRAPERVSVSFVDLARADALENTPPAKSETNPKTAPPARATSENLASGKNAALSHWRVCKNWSPEPKCTSTFGVTGYQKEAGNLYQAVARFYRPGTGRFLSQDPWEGDVKNPASLNPYIYGYGNPGSFIDPDGRISMSPEAATAYAASLMKDPEQRRQFVAASREYTRQRDIRVEGDVRAFGRLGAKIVLGTISTAKTLLFGGPKAYELTPELLAQSQRELQAIRHPQDAIRSELDRADEIDAQNPVEARAIRSELYQSGVFAVLSAPAAAKVITRFRGSSKAAAIAEGDNGAPVLRFDTDAEAGSEFPDRNVIEQVVPTETTPASSASQASLLAGDLRSLDPDAPTNRSRMPGDPINFDHANSIHADSGVRFTPDGYPDFEPHAIVRVEINKSVWQ